ncbi:hypothetical protein [Endozoicomonas arenosclerae]|uniref:hypothetical protein n=1 Tax=Endozoicomonas arenosclerae TaxID=1633495 RepID=UPI00078654B4|nr:hypothetical protein [Endozoicomonas arenosclerae]
MSNPGGVNLESGGVTGLSGASPLPEEKMVKGKWLSTSVGKLNSTESKLPPAHNRSLSVPETSIHSRVSSAGSSESEIGRSFQDQAGYILSRPSSPETQHKLVDLFVKSVSPGEMISLWEKQGLDASKAAYMKVLTGEGVDSKAAKKLLGSGKKDKTHVSKTHEFTQALITSLRTTDSSSLETLLGKVKLSDASMQVFLRSVAAGFGSSELRGWNGVPEQSPLGALPDSLGHDPLSMSVSVKTSGKAVRELSVDEVNSLASSTTLRTLEEKQKKEPSVEALTELSVDQQSLLQDSNRMLMTFEVCDPDQQHTSVLFDSRRLPSTAASSEADVAGRERRKDLLEAAFASTIDKSQNGLTVFRALSHQGPLNELVTKFYPLLPKGPTMQQGTGVQDGSEVRFVLLDPEHMTVVSTNKYDHFSDSRGMKEVGEGHLRLKFQLEKRDGIWCCQHVDVQYSDNVNGELKPVPVATPNTPKHQRKNVTAHKRSMSDSGLKSMAAATQRPGGDLSAFKTGKNDWLMVSPVAAQFMAMVEDKQSQVRSNIKLFEDSWQRHLAAADGSDVKGRQQAGEAEAAKRRGLDHTKLQYQAQLKGLTQSLRESAKLDKIDLGTIRNDVIGGSHYKNPDDDQEYLVTDDELKQLFKSEVGQYQSIRERYRAKAFEAYEVFRKDESDKFDVDREGYALDEKETLDQLVGLYRDSHQWHVDQVDQIKARQAAFAASRPTGKDWIESELQTMKALEKESEQLIRAFRESGSEGYKLKQKLDFNPVTHPERETNFSELSSRTFVHQRAFLSLLAQYEANLKDRLEALESGVGRVRVSSTSRERVLSSTDNDFLRDASNEVPEARPMTREVLEEELSKFQLGKLADLGEELTDYDFSLEKSKDVIIQYMLRNVDHPLLEEALLAR